MVHCTACRTWLLPDNTNDQLRAATRLATATGCSLGVPPRRGCSSVKQPVSATLRPAPINRTASRSRRPILARTQRNRCAL